LKEFGHEPTKVNMKISFGKDKTAWNNHGKEHETELIKRMRPEIKRFGELLKWISRFEFIFIFVPIEKLLKIMRFSEEFRNYMIFPLTALFFGTGNQTPHVSSAIIARVFLDPDLRLFDYDPEYLLSQSPDMFAFSNLESIYTSVIENSKCNVFFNRQVARVTRTANSVRVQDTKGVEVEYDEIVFACDAETTLKLIGPNEATFLERKVLGNVKYFNDVTVTHTDVDYMNKYYEMVPNRGDQYFIRIDPDDTNKLDMSFNLSNYQPQLVEDRKTNPDSPSVFQTIFLDDTRADLWSKNEIKQEHILLEKWWHQMVSHPMRNVFFTNYQIMILFLLNKGAHLATLCIYGALHAVHTRQA
jgi:hypothetical protein